MAESVPNHNIEYPGYFSRVGASQLLRLAARTKDAGARLPLEAAAYDLSRNDTCEDDPSLTGRAASLAMRTSIELGHSSDAIGAWYTRAVGALTLHEAVYDAESTEDDFYLEALRWNAEETYERYLTEQARPA